MSDVLTATAFHEAGHAVIGFLFETRFEPILLDDIEGKRVPGPTPFYVTQAMQNLRRSEYRQAIREDLIVAMSGAIAEERFTGQLNEEAARDDFHFITEALWVMYAEQSDMHSADLWREARRLVNANWLVIERVAAHLSEHRSLSRRELDTLLMPRSMLSG